jgi:glycerol-3-phosphate dehydrogenase (NAD(P)+)
VIAVVGAGSWGTALTIHLARTGAPIRLWAREPEIVDGIRTRRRNPVYMPDFDLPLGVEATGDIAAAVDGAEVIVMVVPSEFFAATLASVPVRRDTIIVSATKGFDPVRHARMSELVRERFPQARVAALSGPTFAREVALGSPTAAVIWPRASPTASASARTRAPRWSRAGSPR